MRSFGKPLAAVSLLGLAACGGGGGGWGTTSASGALNYAPVYSSGPADTVTDAINTRGATGTLALATGLQSSAGLTSIRVRLSADRQTAFVTIGDGPERTLAVDPDFAPAEVTGGGYGDSSTPSVPFLGVTNLDVTSLVSYTVDSTGGFGIIGIETLPADLVSGSYTGTWTGFINPTTSSFDFAAGGGDLTLLVDFGGSVGGSFTGSFNDGAPRAVVGSVSGTTTENGLFGTFSFDSGKYQGTIPFAGKSYGDNSDVLAGSLAGSIENTSNGQNQALYGYFTAE